VPSGNDGTWTSSIGDGSSDNAVGSERYASRHDGDREREVILDGISTLQKHVPRRIIGRERRRNSDTRFV
jgi:hypothetical protein